MTMYVDLERMERTRPRCKVCGKIQYPTRERAMFRAVFLVASGASTRRLVPNFEHSTWHLTSKNLTGWRRRAQRKRNRPESEQS